MREESIARLAVLTLFLRSSKSLSVFIAHISLTSTFFSLMEFILLI